MRVLMELWGRKGDMEQEMVVAYNNSVENNVRKYHEKMCNVYNQENMWNNLKIWA